MNIRVRSFTRASSCASYPLAWLWAAQSGRCERGPLKPGVWGALFCLGVSCCVLQTTAVSAQGAEMGWEEPSATCKPGPGPFDPPPDCSQECACQSCPPDQDPRNPAWTGSLGEPHLLTLDLLAYEFQQVGEYVLLSDGGDFVVQTRCAPWQGSSTFSANQAIAANVAGDRVGVYYGAAEPLLIDGAPAAVPATGLQLAHGGRVVRSGGAYVLTWPSGERVTLLFMATESLINVIIDVPDRTRSYVGLLGTWDGDPRNDLVTRTGEVLPWPATAEDVYGGFGDSWRVTPQESLFDYGPGQDTTTFTDESFPSQVVTAQTLPTAQFNQALDACIAAGVTEEAHLDGCILDVAASGGDEAMALAAAMAAPPPALERLTFSGYYQNFEGADDGQWSTTARFQMPAMDVLASTSTLGLVQAGETIVLTVSGLPAHSDLSVAFDTHVVGPWGGNVFEAAADGVAFTSTSFSNTAATQKFPGQLSDVDRPAQSEALVVGSLGILAKAIYHHSYTFAHSGDSVVVSFRAPSLPQGASFALDNVAVVAGVVGEPWDPKCALDGSPLDDGNPCTTDQCDPGVGAVHTPRASGTACGDLDLCDGEETCDAYGNCVGTPLSVGDGNPCTVDSCDPRFGVVHDPLPLGASCSDGQRCNGAEFCNGMGACTAGTPPSPATLPADTTCDGVDDDCDGAVDDDYAPPATTCGSGACAATGQLVCTNGATRDTCVPLVPASGDFVCDGIDEDCSGTADEDYVPVQTSTLCGLGACVRHGITSCVDGAVVEKCLPGFPAADDAACDGVDSDCDGVLDEDFASVATTCGTGPCSATGTTSCVAGRVVDSCVAGSPPAADDADCDGIDADCSGTADEDYVRVPTAATCGVGACVRQGLTSCVSGTVVETCTPGTPSVSDASCDGVDDDCNGVADEEFVPVATTCGLGICATTGVSSCVDGVFSDSCVAPQGLATDGSCDGRDDNCNGLVDEGYVPRATSCNVGSCAATGTTSCVNGTEQDSCVQPVPAADDATCNLVDDDCDGSMNEDYVSVTTYCGVGACARTGSSSCFAGSEQSGCTPGTPAVGDATCNGIDDDCDGTTDENYVPSTIVCGMGACARWGTISCIGGVEQPICEPGTPAASDATCNNVDDDCDGATDEDYVSAPSTCGVGACASTGATSCVAGAIQDSCTASCEASCADTVDEDRDGAIDCADADCVTNSACFTSTWTDGRVRLTVTPTVGDVACADGWPTPSVSVTGSIASSGTIDRVVMVTFVDGVEAGEVVVALMSDFVLVGRTYTASFAEAPRLLSGSHSAVFCFALATATERSSIIRCVTQRDYDVTCADTTFTVGQGCTSEADCSAGQLCETSLPGGYCFLPCDTSQPVSQECPIGLACWLGSECVVPCNADNSCDDPRLSCGGFESAGLPPDAFCHPTCAESCVNGGTCNATTNLCGAPCTTSDSICDGVDEDCDGVVDDDYFAVTTTCGVGACAASGVTSCQLGMVVDSCAPGAPAPADSTCDGIDDDCSGQSDEDYASAATSCGSGTCVASGATFCAGGQVQDSCTVSCEGACSDTLDDDGDGLVDCADADCISDVACATPSTNTVGQPCMTDAECSAGERCETAMPGGYCFLPCDTSQPVGQQCPAGLICWLGSACVVPCGPGDTCSDPRLTCGDYSAAGLPPDPFCHPTCVEGCVTGASCDPYTNLCF